MGITNSMSHPLGVGSRESSCSWGQLAKLRDAATRAGLTEGQLRNFAGAVLERAVYDEAVVTGAEAERIANALHVVAEARRVARD